MKLGKLDFGMKNLSFRCKADGEVHNVGFQYTWRKGIQDVWFDGYQVEILDAYPPLPKAIQRYALIIIIDLKFAVKKFLHKMKDPFQSNRLNKPH